MRDKVKTSAVPFAVEPWNFAPGDVVRRFYDGKTQTPYVGVVVRIDKACDKVDVEWPMGTERVNPEFLIKQNYYMAPPNINPEDLQGRVASAGKFPLKMADIEAAAETLLVAGYSESDTIRLLTDGFHQIASGTQIRAAIARIASSLEINTVKAFLRNLAHT